MTRLRYTMFAVTVLLVLALSAMSTVPALADDTPPPPTETPTVETPPTEEVPAADAPVVVEEPVAVEVTAPAEEPAPQEETTAEVLASVPEGTEVVVVDAEGETVPLVTQEAADAIAFVDPVWCPTGVAPQDLLGGCSDSYGSLKELVDALMAGTAGVTPATNGVIWIAAGADASTGAILLDGADLSLGTMETFSLTLKGGWNGTFGSMTTSSLTPSTFTKSISIINWLGDITLTDITVSGVTVTPGIASNNAALNVQTSKKITLTNVKVNSNNDPGAGIVNGAWLDNDEGTVVSDVSITNSQFNDNEYVGLTVNSDGVITLAGVFANGNLGGATLDNSTAATAKAVTIITGANEFSDNVVGHGLYILSKGVITLKDITANNNGGDGMTLDNTIGAFVSGITFTGTTIASDNGDEGIEAFSDGAITASNLVANSNGGYGVYFDNDLAATALGVTISGSSNQFKFNSSTGLIINSNGAILLNSISANSNGAEGAVLDNDGFSGGLANVTLTGTNSFRENFFHGLFIVSDGVVTLSNITANDNGIGASAGVGVSVDNDEASTPKAVTLTGVNQFINNYDGGLSVISDGAITISNLTAILSQSGDGVYLENNHNTLVPQNVTVSGYANVSNNSVGAGMQIWSYGIVSLTNVTANNNTGNGLYVDNSTGTLPRAISISGINNFNGNGAAGLIVLSLGAITVSNATASDNTGYGAYLDNDSAMAVGGITLTAASGTWNEFARNSIAGIEVYSKGNITLPITDAFENGSYGVFLDNNAPGATGNVSVGLVAAGLCSYQSDNFYSGLEVYTNGTVTLASLCNFDNRVSTIFGYGAYIDNTSALTPKAVTLLGENDFTGNFNSGLYILTKGAVVLNKLAANDNGEFGAFVDNNTNNLVPQNVTLNGYGDFIGNGDDGLQIATYGLVTLNSLYADSNNGEGIYVDNATGATIAKGVTISGYATATFNNGDGLYVRSLGAISVANLDAGNNNYGATLTNDDAATPAPVTITGGAFTYDNSVGYGLVINSKGAITINVVDSWAGNNATFGWNLSNNFAGAIGGVTLTPGVGNSIDFSGNGTYGLHVESLGSIKVTNLDSYDNGMYGAELDNALPGSVGTVTITTPSGNNTFNGNGYAGLIVYSNRAITITNLYAEGNGFTGAFIDNTNSGAGSPQPVTIIGKGQFYGNGDDGLDIYSYGAITTNNLTANDNGTNAGVEGWGVILDNCSYNIGTSTCDAVTAKGVTMNGTNTFNGNYQSGLWVNSLGAIKGNNLNANLNGLDGAYLFNQYGFGFFGVTLTGTNVFETNDIGLEIYTNGVVTLNNISANWNTFGDGAHIDAVNTVNGPPNVTLTGNNFFLGNAGTGLTILSTGVLTLNNITANWNGAEGAYLDNYILAPGYWTPVPANTINLMGINTFNGNGLDGLYFNTYGNASITKITADENGGDGVDGYSDFGNITITCGSMTNNTGYGWSLDSTGIMTLKGVFATGNTAGNAFQPFGTLVTVRTCP